MREYLLGAAATGVILLCIWLNLANGHIQSLLKNITTKHRLVSISLALILFPFLIIYSIEIATKIPESTFSLLAIPLTSGFTGLFIFVVNLRLEYLKQERERKSTAKLLAALIESKISVVRMLQPQLFERKINMLSNLEVLGRTFNTDSLNKIFIEKGGIFSDELVGWIAFYLDVQRANRDFLILAQRVYDEKEKENGVVAIAFLEQQRKNLDHKLETLIVLGYHLLVLLSKEALWDFKKGQEHSDYIEKVRCKHIKKKGLAYSNILDFVEKDFGKVSSPFSKLIGDF